MGRGKRRGAILITSSDDDEVKDRNFVPKSAARFSKSAPTNKNPKRAKKVAVSRSYSSSFQSSGAIDFNEVYSDVCFDSFTFILGLRTLELNKITGFSNLLLIYIAFLL